MLTAAVFPQLRADLTPWPGRQYFFVIMNLSHCGGKEGFFKLRHLPPPITGNHLPTDGPDAVVPPEMVGPNASLHQLMAALSPERALMVGRAGRAVRLGNIRQRVDRGTILQRLESFGVHGIISRTTSDPLTEPIVQLPRRARRGDRSR